MTSGLEIVYNNLGNMNIKLKGEYAILNGGLNDNASLDSLKFGIKPTKPFATFEPDYWALTGDYKIMPVDGSANIGWLSTVQSGSSAPYNYSSPYAELTIDFDAGDTQSFDGLYLTFGSVVNDYPDTVVITYYDSGLSIISSATHHPTSYTLWTGSSVSGVRRILISIQSASKSTRFARLTAIDFENILWRDSISGDEIKSSYIVEECKGNSLELPISTLEFSLINDSEFIDIEEPTGIYVYLVEKAPLDVYADIKNENRYMGRYYVDTRENRKRIVTFNCVDIFGILDTLDFYGWAQPGVLINLDVYLYEFLDFMLSYTDADFEYYIPETELSSNTEYGVFGNVPPTTCRDAIQQVLFNNGLSAKTVRLPYIHFFITKYAQDLTTYDHNLTTSLYKLVSIEKVKGYTGVQIKDDYYYSSPVNRSETIGDYKTDGTGRRIFVFSKPYRGIGVSNGTRVYPTDVSTSSYFAIVDPSSTTVHIVGNPEPTSNAVRQYPDTGGGITDLGSYPLLLSSSQTKNINNAEFLYKYYLQTVRLKIKTFGHPISAGETALVTLTNGSQISAVVESVKIDASKGFVSESTLVGVVL